MDHYLGRVARSVGMIASPPLFAFLAPAASAHIISIVEAGD
jgi:hypothetical protein